MIQNTADFVKEQLANTEGGHDWWHIYRVWNNTKLILKTEKADRLICELGALLHDISDHKFHSDPATGPDKAGTFLRLQAAEERTIHGVIDIIENISFSSSFEHPGKKSPELQVVQDADRLDAMGAIGIARAFNYGGFKNRKIYDPQVHPVIYSSTEEYAGSQSPTINHFYEKLLLLKDRMNTATGKAIAEKRHEYMEDFLNRFFEEWKGK